MIKDKSQRRLAQRATSHMPENSFFYEKIVPVLLIILGIVMVSMIIFATGIILGLIKF